MLKRWRESLMSEEDFSLAKQAEELTRQRDAAVAMLRELVAVSEHYMETASKFARVMPQARGLLAKIDDATLGDERGGA